MKRRIISGSCCVLLAVLFLNAHAQEARITVRGRVMGEDARVPVPYATIRISNKGMGTVANSNGEFNWVLTARDSKDSLQVSSVGYQTKTIAISSLSASVGTVAIALQKSIIQLTQVSIEHRDPLKIITRAIEQVKNNYIGTPHVIEGFYRNVTTNKENYLQLSEAVFDVYNFGYDDTKHESRLRLIKSRDIKNQRDFHGLQLGWRAAKVMNSDVVKNIRTNPVFGDEGLKRHRFECEGIVDYQGMPAYEITFTERGSSNEITYRGKVFIDTKSFAFLNFDYHVGPAGLNLIKVGDFSTRLLMKAMNLDIKQTSERIQVSYQRLGTKWVLAGVSADNDLQVKSPPMKYDFTAHEKFTYIVTKIDTTDVAPFDTRLANNALIEDQDTDETDSFWKDYTIILPDFNSEAVIRNINAINQVRRLKSKYAERERKLPKDPALRIDSMLTFYNRNGQFNGSALVKQNGKVILDKSYGYANLEQKFPANAHTTYRIGSLSKSFTAVLISQMINEGKLDSMAPVRTYLPWYEHGDVTIEQLLTHRSGIPGYLDNDGYKAQIFSKTFTLKELVEKFCSDTLEFKSGTKFNYSNSGFLVLALIAQEVAGKPFAALLQERIFTPLHMADTYAGEYTGTTSRQAIGYTGTIREAHYDQANVLGAGGISSSAADLLKLHEGLQDNALFPEAVKLAMLRPRVAFPEYNGWYDYGWMTDKNAFNASGKHVITYHPGTDMGFFTMFVRQEDNNNCIILLNNTGDFPRYDVVDLMLDDLN